MQNNLNSTAVFKTVLVSSRTCLTALLLTVGSSVLPVHSATVTYTEDLTDFPNPERGFWGPTVIRKYFTIGSSPLSQSFLDNLDKYFNDIRNSKRKIVPRFAYGGSDAPLSVMLAQMEQLRPVFERHWDVIAVLEMGFIGHWGEWHSSSHIQSTDFVSKKTVLFKMLDVLPKERMVALRYNVDKRAIFETNEPLPVTEAFSGSNRARTGAHNDCFITNEYEAGTYKKVGDYGGWGLGLEAEKTFLSADNLYVPQDGETCQVGSTSYANCARALADLARMRWDMINDDFNESVLNLWKNQGCYNEISRRLGYRIVLIDGIFDDEVTDGTLDATLRLKNVGFGKIYNAKKVELVLRNSTGGREYVLPINLDPRFWSPGSTQTLAVRCCIPDTVPLGTYALYLSIRDPAPKLYGIPQYSIRLANKDVWDAVKGYNALNHSITINSHSRCEITSAKHHAVSGKKTGILAARVNADNRSVEISFNNPRPLQVRIDVYDLSGRIVTCLADQFLGSGERHVTWNRIDRAGRVQPAGVYFVTRRSEGLLDGRQVVLR